MQCIQSVFLSLFASAYAKNWRKRHYDHAWAGWPVTHMAHRHTAKQELRALYAGAQTNTHARPREPRVTHVCDTVDNAGADKDTVPMLQPNRLLLI